MRIKLTLQRPDSTVAHVTVTADATAAVQNVAEALYAGDPTRGWNGRHVEVPDRLSLQVAPQAHGGALRVLSPRSDLMAAGLHSGSVVSIVRVPDTFEADAKVQGTPAAALRVLSGPGAGQEFPLLVGETYIGRDQSSDIQLRDALVSKRHARISVGETVEIVDLHSANGLMMGGRRMSRAILSPSDVVTIGHTKVSVVAFQQSQALAPSSPVVEFNRSPRVVARFPPRVFTAPSPPRVSDAMQFPYIALIAPLVMAPVMYLMTKQIISLLFILLMPLLLIATHFDEKIQTKKRHVRDIAQFKLSLEATREAIDRVHVLERAVRLAEHPSTQEAIEAIRQLGPLLWTQRPEHHTFLSVRFGLGTGVSRTQCDLPQTNETLPEYWSALERLEEHCVQLADVPMTASLQECGSMGVAGPSHHREAMTRSLIVQLIAYHSPAELILTSIISHQEQATWDWLQWLPHCGSSHSPLGDADHLADDPVSGVALLSQLEELIEARGARLEQRATARGGVTEDEPKTEPLLPVIIVLITDDAPVERSRITRLAERGPDAGVHVIWVASSVEQLPSACRTFVVAGTDATTGEVRLGKLTYPVRGEPVDLGTAQELARILCPLVDAGVPTADDSDLPRSVSYVTLAGNGVIEAPSSLVERWRENGSLIPRDGSTAPWRKAPSTLRALVGHTAVEPLYLDLRMQGPHALVGGTTGAGKSEFLQSWVLGMATAYSPDRITFLFVDYKGGAAFADCVKLPHTVGLVTDLSQHLVRRALTSLRAELHHREHLLNAKKAKDLMSLERTGDPECPPSLVIIVDEFAALANEIPEFVDGVVDIAQRGRSLGLHLVLATQRPAGVIKDNLRANTNLRVALRMNDEADSTDILEVPLAAHFDPSIPGRGAVKTGPGRITPFQTAYAGGWTRQEPDRPRIDVEEMTFGAGERWEIPEPTVQESSHRGPNDIARIVAAVEAAAELAQVPKPRKPWLEELAETYDLALLPNPRTDEQLLLGVVDDPRTQTQPTVFFEPDRDGNLAIYGTGGSGKSAALRTICVSAAITARGGPIQVYAIDSASGLRMLEGMPHVGAVISTDDSERVTRLLRFLQGLVDERLKKYAELRAGNIGEYRKLANHPDEPRILLLIDGMTPFREEYEYKNTPWFPIWTVFSQIATDGRQVGVHLMMTGDQANAIPRSLASTIQKRIVLRLASEGEYQSMDVPSDVLSAASPPGRAIIEDNEMQFAILGGDANVAIQARELSKLKASMARVGVPQAPPIKRLPDKFMLASLPPTAGGQPTIGLDDIELAPVGMPHRGTFLLSGLAGGGRTTALVTMAQSLRNGSHTRMIYLAPRRTSLSGLAVWDSVALGEEEVAELANELTEAIKAERHPSSSLAIVAEAITDLSDTIAEMPLCDLAQACTRGDQLLIGEGEASTWTSSYSLLQPFKSGRTGLILTPSDMEGDMLLGTGFGPFKASDFPPGRGYLVVNGRPRKVHIALPS